MTKDNGEWRVTQAEFKGFVRAELENQKEQLKIIHKLLAKRTNAVDALLKEHDSKISLMHYMLFKDGENKLEKLDDRIDNIEKVWIRVVAIAATVSGGIVFILKFPEAFLEKLINFLFR